MKLPKVFAFLLHLAIALFVLGSLSYSRAAGRSTANVQIQLRAYPDLGALGDEVDFQIVDEQGVQVDGLRLDKGCSCLTGKLPFGDYVLTVNATGFVSRSVALSVQQRRYQTLAFLAIGNSIGYSEEPDPSVSILMTAEIATKYDRLYVRLVPLSPPSYYVRGRAERLFLQEWRAGSDRPLVFRGVDSSAPYLVLVTSGERPDEPAIVSSGMIRTPFSWQLHLQITEGAVIEQRSEP